MTQHPDWRTCPRLGRHRERRKAVAFDLENGQVVIRAHRQDLAHGTHSPIASHDGQADELVPLHHVPAGSQRS